MAVSFSESSSIISKATEKKTDIICAHLRKRRLPSQRRKMGPMKCPAVTQ